MGSYTLLATARHLAAINLLCRMDLVVGWVAMVLRQYLEHSRPRRRARSKSIRLVNPAPSHSDPNMLPAQNAQYFAFLKVRSEPYDVCCRLSPPSMDGLLTHLLHTHTAQRRRILSILKSTVSIAKLAFMRILASYRYDARCERGGGGTPAAPANTHHTLRTTQRSFSRSNSAG